MFYELATSLSALIFFQQPSAGQRRKDLVCPEISCKCGNSNSHITESVKEGGNQSKRDVILEGKMVTQRSS